MSDPTSLPQALDHPETLWRILRNHEGRYSVYPAHHDVPPGWEPVGKSDTRSACLAAITRLWTDMRPEALRDAMLKTTRGEAQP